MSKKQIDKPTPKEGSINVASLPARDLKSGQFVNFFGEWFTFALKVPTVDAKVNTYSFIHRVGGRYDIDLKDDQAVKILVNG